MTTGIQGTGPYSKLRDLRVTAKQIKYEIEMKDPGPRKLKALRTQAAATAKEIKALLAAIKAERGSTA